MPLTRDEALAALGLAGAPDVDTAVVQRAFERLARRYPQPSFPERFRQLLDARDQLLDAGRSWRELVESRTLDLTWILPHLAPAPAEPAADHRTLLQAMLRAGYLAEPMSPPDFDDDDDDDFDP
jgi:hypothetical protein